MKEVPSPNVVLNKPLLVDIDSASNQISLPLVEASKREKVTE